METVVLTGSRNIEASELGDYKLYALPNATDLWANQTKQVQFLEREDVPFERIYTYDVTGGNPEQDEPAVARIRLMNTEAAKLGKPMPAGSLSVVGNAQGSPIFLGQDRIQDVSVGLPIELTLGQAMGIRVRCVLASEKAAGTGRRKTIRRSYEIEVRNDKPVPVAFEVRQPMQDGSRIVTESQQHTVKPAGFVWALPLQPNENKALRFTIEEPR